MVDGRLWIKHWTHWSQTIYTTTTYIIQVFLFFAIALQIIRPEILIWCVRYPWYINSGISRHLTWCKLKHILPAESLFQLGTRSMAVIRKFQGVIRSSGKQIHRLPPVLGLPRPCWTAHCSCCCSSRSCWMCCCCQHHWTAVQAIMIISRGWPSSAESSSSPCWMCCCCQHEWMAVHAIMIIPGGWPSSAESSSSPPSPLAAMNSLAVACSEQCFLFSRNIG